jgi:hypothetical protein
MQNSTPRHPTTLRAATAARQTTETTLYDLIAALNEVVEAGEETLVTAAVVHLLNSGRARFAGDHRLIKVVCS